MRICCCPFPPLSFPPSLLLLLNLGSLPPCPIKPPYFLVNPTLLFPQYPTENNNIMCVKMCIKYPIYGKSGCTCVLCKYVHIFVCKTVGYVYFYL